jgi:ATP-binding cassette subfamily B multidrug efflux pump
LLQAERVRETMLAVFQKLGWFFRLEWKRYTVAITLLIVVGFLEIIPPKLVGNAIDEIHHGTITWRRVTEILVLFSALMIVIYAITYIWFNKLFGGSFVVERMMRSQLMRQFLKMTPAFYERNRTGDLMARATNDLQAVGTTAGFGILTVIDSTVWMFTLIIMMAVLLSWKLTLAAILPLPILAILVNYYGKWIHDRFTAAQDAFGNMNANRIIQTMRTEVFGHIHRLPIRYFDNLPAGKVVSRITNDTESIRDLYVTVLANFFSGSVYMTGIFIALFFLDVRLALICLGIAPLLAAWIIVYRKFAKHYNQMIRSTLSDINGMINESIQGMTIIQAFRREKNTEREFEEYNEKHFNFRNKLLRLNSLTSFNLVNVIRNLAFIAFIWYFGGVSLSSESVVSLGVLYAFVDYLNRLFQPIVGIVNQLPNLETALVSAERVFVLLDEEGEDVSDVRMERYKGNVAFENVWFAYKEKEFVLKGISLAAKQGQTVALIGHTGSGKSSILNLLFRFYDVGRGRITIDGTDIRDLPRQTVRKHMGIVLQDPFLFTGTIADNVSLGDSSISRERVEKALADVGADRVLRHLPKGYDEPVIEKGSTLSAGQRQLISFARALAFNPAILILDEATSSIDTETETIIQKALEVVKKGRTTFIIAHRLSTIKNADIILVLDHGEIMERGSHDELMERKGRYYQMYRLQQGEKQGDAAAEAAAASSGSTI